MAKKSSNKATKKKKQTARSSSTTKTRVKASAPVEKSTPKEKTAPEVVTAATRSEAQGRRDNWGWPAYLGLAIAALMLLVAAWLVLASYGRNPQQSTGSGGESIPLSGEANPTQLQAGPSTNVQSGQAPQGASSGASNPQPQQTMTPEQYRGLQ